MFFSYPVLELRNFLQNTKYTYVHLNVRSIRSMLKISLRSKIVSSVNNNLDLSFRTTWCPWSLNMMFIRLVGQTDDSHMR